MPGDREHIELIVQQGLEAILDRGESMDSFLAQYPALAEEVRPSLEAALWLQQNRSTLNADETFVQASKARLMAKIAAEGGAAAKHNPGTHNSAIVQTGFGSLTFRTFWESLRARRFTFRVALAFLIVLAFIVTSNGVALAARKAIPGDTLYPVKRLEENLRLAFSFLPENDLRLKLEFAEQRVLEMQELVLKGRLAYLEATQASHSAHLTEALALLDSIAQSDPARAQQLAFEMSDSLAGQLAVLDDLVVSVPELAQATIATALVEVNSALSASQEIGDGVNLDATPTPTPTPTPSPTPSATSSPISGVGDDPALSATPTATASSTQTSEPEGAETTATATKAPNTGASVTPNPTSTEAGANPQPTQTLTDTPLPPSPPLPSDTPEPTKTPRPSNTPLPTRITPPTSPPQPTSTPRPSLTPPPTSTPRPPIEATVPIP